MNQPAAAFRGGRNIAMKVPPHLWQQTVDFYRDVLGLEQITAHAPEVGFVFGANQLWIDRVPALSQAELWLELTTDDIAGAAQRLQAAGTVRCDEVEPLGDDAQAFWIQNPAAIVHLVCPQERGW